MHLVFLLATVLVVIGGVKSGIEKFSKITLPVLFILIVALAIYAVSLPGAKAGVDYLFKPDFSQMTPKTFTYALGQSFYSLSLGMGCIITYGSYVSKKENLLVASTGTAVSDLLFAILAGFAIMPAVFAAGIKPGAGPGLIFQSIPYIFSQMAQAYPTVSAIMAILFFFTVTVAAMTSCISLIEVGTAYLVEKYKISRLVAASGLYILCGGAGILCAMSFGPLSGFTFHGKNIFDLFDWMSSNVFLLLLGLLAVIFVGFVMKKADVKDEFTNGGALKTNNKVFGTVYFLIRWICPVALALIFVTNFIF